ncbi:MAG: DUF4386 family protein [Anaerolineales bacterium]|nr:DUF4386 family protein [Anaerolineales bacterium]
MSTISQPVKADNIDGSWRGLYMNGGIAMLLTFLYIPIQIITFMTTPEPTNAINWFNLFQKSKFQGLLSFEFLFIVTSVIGITTHLALYVTLRKVNQSWMAIALAFSLLGAVCIIVAKPAIDMIYLADQYTAATTDVF